MGLESLWETDLVMVVRIFFFPLSYEEDDLRMSLQGIPAVFPPLQLKYLPLNGK